MLRPDKSTTKVRIVFDGSSQFAGTSLNDTIYQGPKLQRELSDVLLRFRKYQVCVTCDIAEMYLRIGWRDSDRPYHRFLWRDRDPSRQPDQYEFTRIVFGINASPFLAQFVTQKHARRMKQTFPRAAETVQKSTYMDDSMDSVQTTEEAVNLYEELVELWHRAGMHARKWLSNSRDVLPRIPLDDRAQQTLFEPNAGGLPSVKTLGVLWSADSDTFSFQGMPTAQDTAERWTKRIVLGKVASVFDPLGFVAPFTVLAKMLLQDMWADGLGWDEPLGDQLSTQVRQWFVELQNLPSVKEPRCLQLKDQQVTTDMQLHGFGDASLAAYGAVVYIRCTYPSGEVSCRLVAAKTRVAPLTAMSVPRLELMAAVLATRLVVSTTTTLSVPMTAVVMWSDSSNVLWWLLGRSRLFKPFVANRVSEIHDVTEPQQWRYVPTNDNPADFASRGCSIRELAEKELWWNGPPFLMLDDSSWLTNKIDDDKVIQREVRKSAPLKSPQDVKLVACSLVATVDRNATWRLAPTRFSSWSRLKRVAAWVCRFLENCRSQSPQRCIGELTVDELHDAENRIIKSAQLEAFPDEIKAIHHNREIPRTSKLQHLQPTFDKEGVLRCHGRLQFADFLPRDTVYQIILPRKHWVTRLIIRYYHEKGKHAMGRNHVVAELSSKYWIIAAREAVKECERECTKCKCLKARPAQQVLPEDRIRPSFRAFAKVGVDYGGPFVTVQGRGKARQKSYLCLFTCLTTRAVHLEMAFALDTDSFLNAFYRMVARRGLPEKVLSDNGTNFVGAVRELKELVEKLDRDKVIHSTANQGIEWKFNPPAAPHFGGPFEIMIKAAKRAIFAILGSSAVTDEELMTAFVGAEALINSRPLTTQSTDLRDEFPLTPNHFLFGQSGGLFAPESVDTTSFNHRKRWRRVQELVKHFWRRWIREWLPQLSSRRK